MNLNSLIQHKLTSYFCSLTYNFTYFALPMCAVLPPFVDLALRWVAHICVLITLNSCVVFYSPDTLSPAQPLPHCFQFFPLRDGATGCIFVEMWVFSHGTPSS